MSAFPEVNVPQNPDRWEVSFNLPRELVMNSNDRKHWRAKAKQSAALRMWADSTACSKGGNFTRQVHAEAEFLFPTRRRRDVHNLMPTMKPIIDGLVDAGILVDDSTKHLVGPDLRVSEELCDKAHACTIRLTLSPVAA